MTVTLTAEAAWDQIAAQCRRARPDAPITAALRYIRPVEIRDGDLVLEAEGSTYDLIVRGYGRFIESRAQRLGLRGALLRRATPTERKPL